MSLSFHQVYVAHVCSLKHECRGGLTEPGPSVLATVCFTMTHQPPNTSTHRSHPCHRRFPVSVRASNRKGTLDQWPSDSHRLITSHSSPTSLFWALLLGEQLFTVHCLPINLFMLFFSILFITSFSDIHITRPLNHSKTHIHASNFLCWFWMLHHKTDQIQLQSCLDCFYRGGTAIKWRIYFTDKLYKSYIKQFFFIYLIFFGIY